MRNPARRITGPRPMGAGRGGDEMQGQARLVETSAIGTVLRRNRDGYD